MHVHVYVHVHVHMHVHVHGHVHVLRREIFIPLKSVHSLKSYTIYIINGLTLRITVSTVQYNMQYSTVKKSDFSWFFLRRGLLLNLKKKVIYLVCHTIYGCL